MKVSFLLGAGFSFQAGLPLVPDIAAKFQRRPLYDHTLSFVSGEWKWRDWANFGDKANGQNTPRRIPISMLLEELIDQFIEETKPPFFNYETFFQFMYDMPHEESDRYEQIIQKVQAIYDEHFPFAPENLGDIPDNDILSAFYHLVDDMLYLRKPTDEIMEAYGPYIDYLSSDDIRFEVFTLNHDLLLEAIFHAAGITYNDGFSSENSNIHDDDDNRIPIFQNVFGEHRNLVKLHGSIDLYEYRYVRENNKHLGYDYFKTLDYHTKQVASDIDEDGNVRQNFTPFITPQFITGEKKKLLIENDKMYMALYQRFDKELAGSDRLIIVGYSFGDEHINKVLVSALSEIKEVIHIDPYLKFPFDHPNVRLINPLKEKIKF